MGSLFDWLAQDAGTGLRVFLISTVLVFLHISVAVVRRTGAALTSIRPEQGLSKAMTLVSLATSVLVFGLYFAALGLILREFGVSLTAYFASASIMGLAIGFGSQGLVQDVVTGLTLVFSDLFHVGDMVEISGQTGIVRSVGMRFTVIENSFRAEVFIPNRTIANVVNYPRGYIRAFADITLPDDLELAGRMEQMVKQIASSTFEQLPGILIGPPSVEGRMQTSSGKHYLRIKFRLWPGRGGPVETVFKQEVVQALKDLSPAYADWMVTVNYEVEKKPVAIGRPRR